jgi:hypothetical protein
VKIEFDGQVRTLDLVHVSLRHALVIQEFTGLTLLAWQERVTGLDFGALPEGLDLNALLGALGDGTAGMADLAVLAGAAKRMPAFTDPAWIMSVAAAAWLMLAQSGGDVPALDDDFDVDVLGFYLAFMTATGEEIKAKQVQDKPAPKARPARRTPSSRQTATQSPKPEATPPPSSTGS